MSFLTREEYVAKYEANQKYSGYGMETTAHMPCPFCAEPDFVAYRILEVKEALSKESVCIHCGRGARLQFIEEASGVTKTFMVQTRGKAPAPYLDWIRQEKI